LAVLGLALARTERARFFVFGILVAAVFARLKGESLLNHFVRGRLYQVIGEHPGVRFNELKRLADVPNGSAVHHLRMLARGGLIRIVVDGTSTRFFDTGAKLEEDAYGLLDADGDILLAVQQHPGLSVVDLSRRIDRSRSATSRAVKRLANLGYVRRERRGRAAAVYPKLKGAMDDRPLTAPGPRTPANSARPG
jgi:predicted transcriptional regulator